MSNYYFADVSHHKEDLDLRKFVDDGHRLLIAKASDSYNLPREDGKFYWNPQNHIDSRFVRNFTGARDLGLAAGGYHFCRWDRPQYVGRDGIVSANLDNFNAAVLTLPTEVRSVQTAILDMEQSAIQLRAAGLGRETVSSMAIAMVKLFEARYDRLILYAGSWWTDEWLTPATTEWMAERMLVWEPEYVAIKNNRPVNPDYAPSVPKGFSNEYATSANDVGKMFAWQFTNKGSYPGINERSSLIDLNQTRMPKEEIYKLFGTDGAVDPPEPPPVEPGPGCWDALKKLLSACGGG